jgi:hypothetical protein
MLDLQEFAQQGYTISPEYLTGLGGEQEVETYVERLKIIAYRPGDQVRLRQDLISQWIDQFASKPQMAEYVSVLRSLKNVGDNRLDIERVHVDAVGDLIYTFAGSDLKVESTFCANALPFIHEYGVLTFQEDRLWFVHIDDVTSEVKQVFELTQEPGRAAQHQLGIDSLESLANLLKSEARQAMAGEFVVENRGAETWGLIYTPWSSSAPEKELGNAINAIQAAMSAGPAFN